ncbi:TetR/AcrR family transcriptional regulator [Deinococcus hopiensis]|uniref:Transcriptional regulator, TetR family n=1 Tax=Deinococcus hopiensis KR-140 TaxID=695939 RepID=A0A1W1VUB4_9DEIO|nr:TetR/AcrR family transcriptional regulator [Deinococcus hopiensis]SMB96916.1 transcriptional regulator, TetR family [Deinococcus hopiensis KR-140]
MPPIRPTTLPLRERKKVLTRNAILDAAEQLFEERGYDNVTVAEIAEAANISVKTLFTYFRSKEDLVFADTELIDTLLLALQERPPGTSALQTVIKTLTAMLDNHQHGYGLEAYHRGFGDAAALQSRLLRMWSEYEDRITHQLLQESPEVPAPLLRFQAIQLVGLVRMLVSPEARTAAGGLTPEETVTASTAWLEATVGLG